MGIQSLIWALIAATGVVDYILFTAQGMTAIISWWYVLFVATLYGLSVVIQQRVPPAARLLNAFAQIFGFSQVGAYLSYGAMAASPFPMADTLLARADAALGFGWLAWFTWIEAHPTLDFILAKSYASVPLQILVLVLYFAYADAKRIDELLLAAILSVPVIVCTMVLLPAVGAWSQHGIGIVEPWRADILALRSHTLVTVVEMKGIVAFPSFHTELGILLANMARGRKWFLPVLILNLALMASVITEGAHYGVDLLGGIVVALVAVVASQLILARFPTEVVAETTGDPSAVPAAG
jgi:membrane-associated phospholipid phosphatase